MECGCCSNARRTLRRGCGRSAKSCERRLRTECEAVAAGVVGATGRSVGFFCGRFLNALHLWTFFGFECIEFVGVFRQWTFCCVTVCFYVCGLGFLWLFIHVFRVYFGKSMFVSPVLIIPIFFIAV